MTIIIPNRTLKWEVTILVLKKLGKRYRLGKLPSGKVYFLDNQLKAVVKIY